MLKKIYKFILPGIFPFSLCVLVILFQVVYKLLRLPSPDVLITAIENYFTIYGFWFLFFAAILEGTFILGMYFPGSLVIVLAVYTLGYNVVNLFYIGSISFFSFLIANVVNYYLGKFGYYKILMILGKQSTIINMKESMLKYEYKTFFLTGFFPNFIAITSVCAGISKLYFKKFFIYLTLSLIFWVTIWTVTGSFIVEYLNLKDNNQSNYLLLLIFLWGVFLILKTFLSKKSYTNV